jgi:mono/diheme cytochrome c family protein
MKIRWSMRFAVALGFASAITLVSSLALAGRSEQASKPEINVVPCKAIISAEGKDNYMAYCAVCHGKDAKGGGPAAAAMKLPVPDLTTLAGRNGGKFNYFAVEDIIRGTGKDPTKAHGTEDMPVWGPVFTAAISDTASRTLRIKNLVTYIQSIQQGTTN